MTTDVKTIQQRIEERADNELKEKIRNELLAVRKRLNWMGNPYIRIPDNVARTDAGANVSGGTRVAAGELLDLLANQIFAGWRDRMRNEATTAFLANLERLQSDVDELRESIPQ